jgi:hypothetical protein
MSSSNCVPARGMCKILQALFRQAYPRTHVPLPQLPTRLLGPPVSHSSCSCPAVDAHASIIRTCSCLLFIFHFMLGIVRLRSVRMRFTFCIPVSCLEASFLSLGFTACLTRDTKNQMKVNCSNSIRRVKSKIGLSSQFCSEVYAAYTFTCRLRNKPMSFWHDGHLEVPPPFLLQQSLHRGCMLIKERRNGWASLKMKLPVRTALSSTPRKAHIFF